MNSADDKGERGPGPIWGGWWMWEPPANAIREKVIDENGRVQPTAVGANAAR